MKTIDQEILVYIDKKTKKMNMRDVATEAIVSENEYFMVITDKLTAMTMCNRYNNMSDETVK